jgi:hypothetical protein
VNFSNVNVKGLESGLTSMVIGELKGAKTLTTKEQVIEIIMALEYIWLPPFALIKNLI